MFVLCTEKIHILFDSAHISLPLLDWPSQVRSINRLPLWNISNRLLARGENINRPFIFSARCIC